MSKPKLKYYRKPLFTLLTLTLFTLVLTTPLIHAQVTSLIADKASYGPADSVNISGKAPPNALVGIQVNDPKETALLLTTVTADANGSFTKKFKLPADALEGVYIVTASEAGGKYQATFTVSKATPSTTPVTYPTSSPNATSATLNVLTAPPRSTEPGASLTFKWEVLGGNPGFIAHTAVHYGPNPGDPAKIFYGFPEFTKEFNTIRELTPKSFAATVQASDKPARIYWRAHAIVDGKDIWSPEGLVEVTVEAEFTKRIVTVESSLADLDEGLKKAQSGIDAAQSSQSKALSDVATIKADVDRLRSGTTALKSDVNGFRSDLGTLKDKISQQSASTTPVNANILTAIAISSLAVAVIAAVLAGFALARARASKPPI